MDFGRWLDQLLATDSSGDDPWLEELARELLAIPAWPDEPGRPLCPRSAAVARLNAAISAHPRAEAIRARIRAFWSHASAVRLLAEMGLPDHSSFPNEALQRLLDKVIPRHDHAGDLYAWLDRLDAGEGDARWLAALPPDLAGPWCDLLRPGAAAFSEAARLLAIRAAGLGLNRDVLRILPEGRDLDSPFATLPEAVDRVVRGAGAPEGRDELQALLVRCRASLAQTHERLEESGVSTDLVFRLDLLEAQLARIQALLEQLHGQGSGLVLAADLLAGAARQHRLRPLLRESLRRLARKVVEHVEHTGEHYLAKDRAEYWAMARAAGGGGALTAFTALLKFLLAGLSVAPGLGGLAAAANYAGSFIALQFLHLTLASKQPAATAAALSGALERSGDMAQEVDVIAAIVRGQMAATLGNLLLAMPVALAVDFLWRMACGHGVLSPEKAAKTMASLHPFHSWTLPFAAITGVMLWMGSLAGGWTANWSAYRNLPEAVARSHRFRRWLGATRAAALGRALDLHLPGMTTCLTLGLLLGFMPVFLAFGGIPVEVRHVTLSAASLAFAVGSGLAAGAVPGSALAWALVGVGCIGLLNFGVSFALSLRLALQARGLEARGRKLLLKAVGKAFWERPGRFLGRG